MGAGEFLNPFLRKTIPRETGKLWIICYHDVAERDESQRGHLLKTSFDVRDLERHLQLYKKLFNIMPLSKALTLLESGKLQKPALSLTFDDGYRSFKEQVLPLLELFNLPATVFVCGSTVAEAKMLWGDGLRCLYEGGRKMELEEMLEVGASESGSFAALSRRAQEMYSVDLRDFLVAAAAGNENGSRRYLSEDDLREMPQNLIEIGSHTWSHAPLAALSEDELDVEIWQNDEYLRKFSCFAPTLSLPFGQNHHFKQEQVCHIRTRFGLFVCSSGGGVNHGSRDADYRRMGGEIVPLELKGHLLFQALK